MSDFEHVIQQAIIDKFFEPTTLIQSFPSFSATGQPTLQIAPIQTEAPALHIARAIWDAKQADILKGVMDRLDVDGIVDGVSEKVTKAVLDRLTQEPSNRSWSANPSPSERERMLIKVYDKLAEEFGRQAVAHLQRTGGLLSVIDASLEVTAKVPEETDARQT